jgi:hypothetical protein
MRILMAAKENDESYIRTATRLASILARQQIADIFRREEILWLDWLGTD